MIVQRKKAIDVVDELLQAQKKALLSGDLSALGQIVAPLERALHRLQTDRTPPTELARVQVVAQRNAALLKAAQNGIATAREQIAARIPSGLSTYDAQGQSHMTTTGASRLLARR